MSENSHNKKNLMVPATAILSTYIISVTVYLIMLKLTGISGYAWLISSCSWGILVSIFAFIEYRRRGAGIAISIIELFIEFIIAIPAFAIVAYFLNYNVFGCSTLFAIYAFTKYVVIMTPLPIMSIEEFGKEYENISLPKKYRYDHLYQKPEIIGGPVFDDDEINPFNKPKTKLADPDMEPSADLFVTAVDQDVQANKKSQNEIEQQAKNERKPAIKPVQISSDLQNNPDGLSLLKPEPIKPPLRPPSVKPELIKPPQISEQEDKIDNKVDSSDADLKRSISEAASASFRASQTNIQKDTASILKSNSVEKLQPTPPQLDVHAEAKKLLNLKKGEQPPGSLNKVFEKIESQLMFQPGEKFIIPDYLSRFGTDPVPQTPDQHKFQEMDSWEKVHLILMMVRKDLTSLFNMKLRMPVELTIDFPWENEKDLRGRTKLATKLKTDNRWIINIMGSLREDVTYASLTANIADIWFDENAHKRSLEMRAGFNFWIVHKLARDRGYINVAIQAANQKPEHFKQLRSIEEKVGEYGVFYKILNGSYPSYAEADIADVNDTIPVNADDRLETDSKPASGTTIPDRTREIKIPTKKFNKETGRLKARAGNPGRSGRKMDFIPLEVKRKKFDFIPLEPNKEKKPKDQEKHRKNEVDFDSINRPGKYGDKFLRLGNEKNNLNNEP